jgi:hypothetical protein
MKEPKQQYMDFDEYIRLGEPEQQEKAANWNIAIGLQAVDGLKPSEYLVETARKNIEGEISIDEVRDLIHGYYVSKSKREPDDDECEEADRVSSNIAKLLNSQSLNFTLSATLNFTETSLTECLSLRARYATMRLASANGCFVAIP